MSRLLFVSAALMILAPAVAGAFGTIELLPVTGGNYESTCNFVEPSGAGPREIAVVLTAGSDTFLGVDLFRVDAVGINWVPLGVSSAYTLVGSFGGMQVGFGSCLAPPVVIATLTYFSPGGSGCGHLRITPVFGTLELLVKCDLAYTQAPLADLTINGVYDMPPGGLDPSCYCPIVATETSTWGPRKPSEGVVRIP